MKKIINYIAGGQGLGIKFTALLALLLSIVFGATVKVMGSDAVPYARKLPTKCCRLKLLTGRLSNRQTPIKWFICVSTKIPTLTPFLWYWIRHPTFWISICWIREFMLPAAIFILPKNMKSVPTNWQTIILNCRGAIIPDFSGAF